MTNVISPYDPIFYAQNGLAALEKALGLAGRVYRGYDKAPSQKGSVIQISRPGTFTAQDAPSSAQDLNPESLQITLDQWKEVKFALTDKELNYTQEQIINDHIRPAAYALADKIDTTLIAEIKKFPYFNAVTLASAGVSDITAARRVLFGNSVPLDDVHMMIDPYLEEKFLALSAFSQQQGAGDVGISTQMRGTLGTKFGFEIFANQNVSTHTSGTEASDLVGAVNNASGYAIGISTVALDAIGSAATVKIGDVVTFTGQTTPYAITADATASTGAITISIYPPLRAALVDNQVATISFPSGTGATKTENFAFHRNSMALAMAPLTTLPSQLGAKVETVSDPITGLSLRSRMFYDGNTSKVYVALDVLFGVKVLDARMGVRLMAV